ncbi:MAG: hypothetical protein AVDCRST_MAG25-223 [uncultured Rubrobacteraceae bacterium]|uniref:PAS domain-containing protein n=1 Tax=uncultured Rubrobacteraceae bacterium TaxID=349277 RepID=A0A6J4QZB4_9ACTN|nr:MAG: hypothetical protein AVDCRST_MAG25-223 [uncultured Rubrobacteraceae bacterium]
MDDAADAPFAHDAEGRFVEVNRHACDSPGYTREESPSLFMHDIEETLPRGTLEEIWARPRSVPSETVEVGSTGARTERPSPSRPAWLRSRRAGSQASCDPEAVTWCRATTSAGRCSLTISPSWDLGSGGWSPSSAASGPGLAPDLRPRTFARRNSALGYPHEGGVSVPTPVTVAAFRRRREVPASHAPSVASRVPGIEGTKRRFVSGGE